MDRFSIWNLFLVRMMPGVMRRESLMMHWIDLLVNRF